MEQAKKRNLLNMTYYALATLAILLSVIFMIYLGTQPLVLYAKIGYWVLSAGFVCLIVFDIICTNIKRFKYVSGIILYVMSLVTFVLTVIVYISLSTGLILTAVQVFPYLALFVLSWTITLFTIALYNVGVKLVDKNRKAAK